MCWGFECGQFGVVRLDTKPRCITYSIHSLSSESSSSVSCGLCLLAQNYYHNNIAVLTYWLPLHTISHTFYDMILFIYAHVLLSHGETTGQLSNKSSAGMHFKPGCLPRPPCRLKQSIVGCLFVNTSHCTWTLVPTGLLIPLAQGLGSSNILLEYYLHHKSD